MLQALPQRGPLGGWRVVELEETLPVETHYRQDGTKLDNKREGVHKGVALLNAQQVLRNNHVTRRRDRQELREALYNRYDNGL